MVETPPSLEGRFVQISGSAVYTWRVQPHTFLWCNTYLMAVQLTFELELTDSLQEQGNSDLHGIKIGPRSCLKKYKVQSECKWAFFF